MEAGEQFDHESAQHRMSLWLHLLAQHSRTMFDLVSGFEIERKGALLA